MRLFTVTDIPADENDWATPHDLFADVDARLGPFTVDVAAAAHNAKCERFYTVEQDGLAQSWAGELVWCNPPYDSIAPWVEKAWAETSRTFPGCSCPGGDVCGGFGPCWEPPAELVAMLLPANRTEQGWWHRLVEPFRDRPGSHLAVEFIRGRVRFVPGGRDAPREAPPFGCCLLIWWRGPIPFPSR